MLSPLSILSCALRQWNPVPLTISYFSEKFYMKQKKFWILSKNFYFFYGLCDNFFHILAIVNINPVDSLISAKPGQLPLGIPAGFLLDPSDRLRQCLLPRKIGD